MQFEYQPPADHFPGVINSGSRKVLGGSGSRWAEVSGRQRFRRSYFPTGSGRCETPRKLLGKGI